MLLRKLVPFAFLAASCSAVVLPVNTPKCLAFSATSNTVALSRGSQHAQILTSSEDWPGVHRVAGDLAEDFQRATGTKLVAKNVTAATVGHASSAIIVGTLGKSALVDALVTAGKVDATVIRGKWEAFIVKHVSAPIPGITDALVIIGSDKRGTIFGTYTVSEQLGVSPWYYWTDTPAVQRNSGVFITKGADCTAGSPTVQYRGIFLNDEQPSLKNWVNEKFNAGTNSTNFRSNFYVHIFEVILRLKANYLWPAMWAEKFGVDDPLNQFTADYYGVVMGTSHQEPMMRSSPNEWNANGTLGQWNWWNNKENVTTYFTEGAKRATPYENLFTVGMRGSGDLPLETGTNIELLEDIITTQRQILSNVFNTSDVTSIPQVWCLYKEVLNYYNAGLRVPDDITLLWTDDNWQHITRLPTESERTRSGGAGIYYHVDYVGDPVNYKWINSINNAHTYQQMSLAVEYNATRIWILNVGDFKGNEIPAEFFLSMAYNASAFTPNNLKDYYSNWATREFQSPKLSSEIGGLVADYGQLAALRKNELTTPATYSTINYREADRINARWSALVATANKLATQIPKAAQNAFFQVLQHPVQASANLRAMYIAAQRNKDLASQASGGANAYAEIVEDAFDKDWELREKYHTINGGKWNHMMDQTHVTYYYWQQPLVDTMPPLWRVRTQAAALSGAMRVTIEGILGAWPGDNVNNCAQGYNCPPPTLPTLSPYGPTARYIDVSPSGPKAFAYAATVPAAWVSLKNANGTVNPTDSVKRIEVAVDWAKFPAVAGVQTTQVTIKSSLGESVQVIVNAVKTAAPADFKGFVEGDGVVSIEAEHWSRTTSAQGVSFAPIPNFGTRASAGITGIPGLAPNFTIGSGPTAEYDFFTFNTPKGGNATQYTVTTYLYSSFNALADGPLTYGISLDGGAAKVVQPIPFILQGQYNPPDWNAAAANGVRMVQTNFTDVQPGKHTLKIDLMSPNLVFEKFVVDVGGLVPSYLGPPESSRV
ncbi:hypothetical protein BKA62DRAFT_767364 [Auriculariales sp. MPI-PUGE-AT-0066]|nr:hypothetical protein BKA62DRAFT_767364 [Auriculariales sp. MPI-PUGE-AT-0066]